MNELRCDNGILFAQVAFSEILGEHLVEVKCRSSRCGAGPGVVVLHLFTLSGELHDTRRYRDPAPRKDVTTNGHHPRSAAVRSA